MELKTGTDGGTYLIAEEWLYIGDDLPGEFSVPLKIKIGFDYLPEDVATNFPETIELGDMEIPDLPDCPTKISLIEGYLKINHHDIKDAIWTLIDTQREKNRGDIVL